MTERIRRNVALAPNPVYSLTFACAPSAVQHSQRSPLLDCGTVLLWTVGLQVAVFLPPPTRTET